MNSFKQRPKRINYITKKKRKVCQMFFDFLKAHDAYDAWRTNIYKQHPWYKLEKKYMIPYLINPINHPRLALNDITYQYKNFIDYSFIWVTTPQDDEYWRHLHNEWLRELKNKLHEDYEAYRM